MSKLSLVSLAAGSALAAAALTPVQAAVGNLRAQPLPSGYQLAQADTKQKDGKCGEAKCGASKKGMDNKSGDKKKDGSCGGKKTEASCGGKK